MPGISTRIATAALFAAASSLALAQQIGGDQAMGEVRIESSREHETAPFSPTQSTTTVDSAQLEMKQPESIFDAVRDVPGVMINGGPRPSGMTFNIRGYNDTEDVRIKLDGITKQFEKYRFGGTFIEPDMLKSIEVQRGPQITSGSGALGGTVSATTKSASDLLQPGQRFGARAKAGYATNNYETLTSLSAFGRPTAGSDLLVNVLKRDAKDYKLPNGSTYPYSETNTQSGLLKGSAFLLDDLMLTASFIAFDDSGPQPYDATGGGPGVGGIVTRTVNDRTLSTTLNYEPGNRWLNLRATIGHSDTRLHDVLTPGLSTLTFPYPPAGGVYNDYYDYDIWNLDLANASAIGRIGGVSISVLTGLQYEHNARDVVRRTQNPAYNAPDSSFFPGGFNPAQPPGKKTNYAAYVQGRVEIGRLELVPGVRWDRYEIEATGQTASALQTYGQASSVSYSYVTPSFGASFGLVRDRLLVFYNYSQGFRPPLLDESFTQFNPAINSFIGRCNFLNLGSSLAPPSGVCGDLYQPEESTTQEVGLSYIHPNFWRAGDSLAAKLTYFRNHTEHLLESITVVAPGVIGQPGYEDRHGVEAEASLDLGTVFGRASYSRIRGTTYTCPNIYCMPNVPANRIGYFDLFDVPGETTTVTLGVRLLSRRLQLAYNLANVGGRNVLKPTATLGQPNSVTHQEGYLLQGASLRYSVNRNLELGIVVDNLTNEDYFYYVGAYQGVQAPGRNIRFTVSAGF